MTTTSALNQPTFVERSHRAAQRAVALVFAVLLLAAVVFAIGRSTATSSSEPSTIVPASVQAPAEPFAPQGLEACLALAPC